MAIHQDSRVEPEYISLREAALIYAVSTYMLRRRIASGDLPAVKLGYKIIRVRVGECPINGVSGGSFSSGLRRLACGRRR